MAIGETNRGDKPHLVLIHGLGSAATYWDNVLPQLAEHFSVRAINLPGHGPSAQHLTPAQAHPLELAASLISSLRADGIERPHVAGLSLGGWVALEIGAFGGASSVVALAPAGLWRRGTVKREREESVARRSLVVLRPAIPSITRLKIVKQIGLRANVLDPNKVSHAQFLAGARALMQAKAYAACDKAMVHSRFENGHKLTVPVSVAFGDHDRVLPPSTSQERSAVPDHARWSVVADCGHAMSWDQPEDCINLITQTAALAAA
jgi:pimeloyl-ACP methyl ester carboxylesterase